MPGQGSEVISRSRGHAASGRWIACDLTDAASVGQVADEIGGPVDALIHVAGIWEETAFSPD